MQKHEVFFDLIEEQSDGEVSERVSLLAVDPIFVLNAISSCYRQIQVLRSGNCFAASISIFTEDYLTSCQN